MTTILVVLAVVVALVTAAFGVVTRRDRRRSALGEDATAVRDARVRQQHYEAERHGSQGDTWQRGQHGGSS
ncbi:MAG: hypothetical protein WA890_01025 [Micromonospora sp.]